ncbi:MAG: response regulator [Gammaproteobacteria bacterium]|nr:response regulator [Gammaproteobacteria bacterium]MDH5735378.1 response regulator [Gammaproteobacteria bacterium]
MKELSAEIKNKKVLIVDDVASMRALLSALLRDLGITRIYEAGNGLAALKVLQKTSIDLVFCDWEMPEKNGLELLEELKQDQQLKNIPFILVTSMAELDKVKKAMDVGVQNYIVKPFSEATLIARINSVF